jgi:hypothetical protein
VNRERPSDGDLEKMAGHILYETRMLEWAIALLADNFDESAEHNALVEVFLLHTRALTEFFASQPKRNDDVVASDYIDNWSPGVDGTALERALMATHKRWGHISLYRLDEASLSNDINRWQENVEPVRRLWLRFFAALTPEQQAWFVADLSA